MLLAYRAKQGDGGVTCDGARGEKSGVDGVPCVLNSPSFPRTQRQQYRLDEGKRAVFCCLDFFAFRPCTSPFCRDVAGKLLSPQLCSSEEAGSVEAIGSVRIFTLVAQVPSRRGSQSTVTIHRDTGL